MLFNIIGAVAIIIAGFGCAFGPIKTDPTKLKPGQSVEDLIKKIRRIGYVAIVCGLFVLGIALYFYFANPFY